MTNTMEAADDFDLDTSDAAYLATIAQFAASHDGVSARVTRAGHVLMSDRDGGIKVARSMRAACEWLGY